MMKRGDYTVGWICALPTEMAAAEGMLDEVHDPLPRQPNDDNAYSFGRIGQHNVVLACLPAGVTGVTSAAAVVEQVRYTFPSLRMGLMVGIGGGVPSAENDMRLGDVVVSKPTQTEGGVIQYDFGKTIQEGKFQRTGMLNRPPDVLLTATSRLQARHLREGHHIQAYLAEMVEKYPSMRKDYLDQGMENDHLFQATYDHELDRKNCTDCDHKRLVSRDPRHKESPEVFYGLIASGSQVMRHGVTRDKLGEELGVICFEMEAAGLINRLPCLIIRGICDYADSHKNKRWQAHAAATAAAYAKELLCSIPIEDVTKEQAIGEILEVESPKNYRLGLILPENAPLIDDESFVGRTGELAKLKETILPRELSMNQRIVTVSGLGGMGKTQLTLSFVRRNQESFSAIFWLDATSESTLRQNLVRIAGHIFDSEFTGAQGEENAIKQVRQWLSEKRNNNWLLVFDNYDEPQLPGQDSPDAYNLRSYFPFSSQGAILISTRNPHLNWGKSIQLKSLADIEQGLEILANRSNRPETKHNSDARKIAERLDGLPLALVTAGSYLSQTPVGFKDYLQMYEESWSELESSSEELPDYEGRTLYSTWNISYIRIQAQDTDTANLLQYFAYLDNQDIWFELLSRGKGQGFSWLDNITSSMTNFNRAMKRLQAYSLIEMHARTGGWSLHNCVHDWTLDCLNPEVNMDLIRIAIRNVGSLAAHHTEAQYWKINRRLLRHADRLKHSRLNRWMEESIEIMWRTYLHNIGLLYSSLGRLVDAKKSYKRALRGYEEEFGFYHSTTSKISENLGSLYVQQGKLYKAEQMYDRTLKGYEKDPDIDQLPILKTFNDLGVLYAKQSRLDEAEDMYERALEGFEKTPGVDDLSISNTLNNLGVLYSRKGRLDDAEEMFDRALKRYETTPGVDHPFTMNTVWNLADLHEARGRGQLAETMYQRALEGYSKALGPDSTRTVETIGKLTALYDRQILAASKEYAIIDQSEGQEPLKSIQTRLHRLLISLIVLCKRYKAPKWTFNRLGHCLLWLEDQANASVAFQQLYTYESAGSTIIDGIMCDGCLSAIPVGDRFVCKSCRDLDLCRECHSNYASLANLPEDCSGHSFFEVPSYQPEFRFNGAEREKWLSQIEDSFDEVLFPNFEQLVLSKVNCYPAIVDGDLPDLSSLHLAI